MNLHPINDIDYVAAYLGGGEGGGNSPPTASNSSVSDTTGNNIVFAASDFNYNDVDGDPMASVKITSLENDVSGDALQLNGVDVTLYQVISKADIDNNLLVFVHGVVPTSNQFSFSVNDGTQDSVGTYTMDVSITFSPP